jgi:hypothetical protein
MKERRRNNFSESIKKDVRRSQNYRCAYCGEFCRGHGYKEPVLEIHHVLPLSLGGANTRENAIGLCPSCHKRHNQEALCRGKLFFETLLSEGRFYEVRMLLDVAGLPKNVAEKPYLLSKYLSQEGVIYKKKEDDFGSE